MGGIALMFFPAMCAISTVLRPAKLAAELHRSCYGGLMNKFAKFAVPALIVGLGVTLTSLSFAGPKIVKETGVKTCKSCHTKGKELNDAGKCYQEKKDLKACNIEVK
jgi:hypothetical protein